MSSGYLKNQQTNRAVITNAFNYEGQFSKIAFLRYPRLKYLRR
jgi:hypothetical protein